MDYLAGIDALVLSARRLLATRDTAAGVGKRHRATAHLLLLRAVHGVGVHHDLQQKTFSHVFIM